MKCVVVRDTITSRGNPVERTFDWYTQDKHGNVWYFGENSKDYSTAMGQERRLVGGRRQRRAAGDHHGGASEARRCLPAGVLPGARRGPGEGVGRHRPGTVPAGTYQNTIGTKEKSRLEPGIAERKWYAPGIGEIKSQDVKGSQEGFRLVKVTH